MDLKEKIRRALGRSIRLDDVHLEDDDGITGYVVSPDFRGLSALDRHELMDKALRDRGAELSRAELRRVLMIAAVTPVEFEAIVERARDDD